MKQWIWMMSVIVFYHSVVLAAELQDPTRPQFLSQKSIRVEQLELNAIIISPDRKIAIINGIALKVGDLIGNARVISIEPNTVQLEGPSGRMKLVLLSESLKQPVVH